MQELLFCGPNSNYFRFLMTFLVFFSGCQFILIPAEVKRTSATLCSFHFLEIFNSSVFWSSSSSRLSLFPILGPHGLPFRRFRRWALVLTRRASFWDSLGHVWQTILRWQACFLFKETLDKSYYFCDWPKTYTRFLITYSS